MQEISAKIFELINDKNVKEEDLIDEISNLKDYLDLIE
jgi:hypothetical protein